MHAFDGTVSDLIKLLVEVGPRLLDNLFGGGHQWAVDMDPAVIDRLVTHPDRLLGVGEKSELTIQLALSGDVSLTIF